jgi:membrane associated rhomboid family serine protease
MDPTSPTPSGAPVGSDTEYCYGHPDTPTRLHCTRCDKPICGRCAVPASVGQHCVWCVAEAKKSAPKVRSTMQATSPAVVAIIAINVVVYILENMFLDTVIPRFAARPPLIADGEYYRLLTPMFLHAPLGARFGIFHILMNMYILRIYGPQVEERFGSARFVVLYLVAGFWGGALSYALGPCDVVGLGASGAIFGVVGILLVLLYRRRHSAFVAQYMRSMLTFVGLNLVIGFTVSGIDNFAHIGGLVGGIALGAGLEPQEGTEAGPGRQIVVIAAVIAAAVALVVWRTSTMAAGCIAFL